jgi:hypothetical protein
MSRSSRGLLPIFVFTPVKPRVHPPALGGHSSSRFLSKSPFVGSYLTNCGNFSERYHLGMTVDGPELVALESTRADMR